MAAVVPCYNEESQVGTVIETMPALIDRIVIIDDACQDRTAGIVDEYRKKDGWITLIRHDVNQGVGGAIATGYKWCRDQNLDIAVVMAGDGQMSPEDLPNLLDPVSAVKRQLHFEQSDRHAPISPLAGASPAACGDRSHGRPKFVCI